MVGEDLGTVEPWVRDYMRERGILGTSTLTLIGYYEPTLKRAVIAGPNVGRSDFVLYDVAKP